MDQSKVDSLDDRAAIVDVVHSYAQAVDRRDASAAADLFTEAGELFIWSTPVEPTATRLVSRAAIDKALSGLDKYVATFHEIVNHTCCVSDDRASATASTSCVAHHITGPAGSERDRIWYLTYDDTFERGVSGWRIAKRELRVRIVANMPLNSN
jgi:ketosteroid isomerase-like protein